MGLEVPNERFPEVSCCPEMWSTPYHMNNFLILPFLDSRVLGHRGASLYNDLVCTRQDPARCCAFRRHASLPQSARRHGSSFAHFWRAHAAYPEGLHLFLLPGSPVPFKRGTFAVTLCVFLGVRGSETALRSVLQFLQGRPGTKVPLISMRLYAEKLRPLSTVRRSKLPIAGSSSTLVSLRFEPT